MHDEPAWISVIDPQKQESLDSIANGNWLFVAFSVWKVPDRDLLSQTLRLVRERDDMQVRIYGYDYAEELVALFPFNSIRHEDKPKISLDSADGGIVLNITGDATASPIWMLFSAAASSKRRRALTLSRPFANNLRH